MEPASKPCACQSVWWEIRTQCPLGVQGSGRGGGMWESGCLRDMSIYTPAMYTMTQYRSWLASNPAENTKHWRQHPLYTLYKCRRSPLGQQFVTQRCLITARRQQHVLLCLPISAAWWQNWVISVSSHWQLGRDVLFWRHRMSPDVPPYRFPGLCYVARKTTSSIDNRFLCYRMKKIITRAKQRGLLLLKGSVCWRSSLCQLKRQLNRPY